jgi:hypothetical protein
MSDNDRGFRVGDLVELKSEAEWNPSLFRIIDIRSATIVLGQLSDDGSYVGVDTAIDLSDPAERGELIHARPSILTRYPHVQQGGLS